MKILILNLLYFISISSLGQQDCNKLQSNFNNFNEALSKIKSTKFIFTEKINTSKSSWIRSASYFSCDNKNGYFIIRTDKQIYIHKDLPIRVWNNFKNTNSYGSFYNLKIKNRYQLSVN
ncbi:KTSC domain-containing protein [Aquirufa esocilacus]|uniref:KTSC domain-containing protein n=1 Tax=Aquirufa esocilacus TaxID=3096513 RepID=UPI003672E269